MVVGFGIFLVHEMHVVGTHQFDVQFTGYFNQFFVGPLLQGEGFAVGPHRGVFHLVALQLQVIVITKQLFIPSSSLPCSLQVSGKHLGRHFTCDTGRTDNQVFMVFLQVFPVGTRTSVESVNPSIAHQFDQILVSMIVLGQHDQVIATSVSTVLVLVGLGPSCHIHFTSENGFERLKSFLLPAFVHI